ncbi:uncharacterized protein LOC119668350 [Teleopsis dalmanni]|uniref:uncharacterized protein LOC119668350 n=1 Tax=Teleopsis dalmanni TaxID=139649 RepID=UPI0018CE9124|nr:uncharacterized protein LOC119668350 [Teleopsis dalmanni]
MKMSDANGQYQKLPPGWDAKYDQTTGNCYYINYFTKAMQLEDPRIRYKQLQNERCSTESIPMQPLHGSPYHVYPTNNLPAMRAFQTGPGTNPSLHNMSSSPLLSSRGNLEMSPVPFLKSSIMQTPRLANMSRRSTIQETSFSNQIDTDAVVTKIQNMFPTASENHIRLLLKKYYNREAVVISALQVEKHPVTMPGPFVTPPAQRHLFHSNSAFHMTPPARRPDIAASHSRGLSGFNNSRTISPIPGGRFGSVMSMHMTDGVTSGNTSRFGDGFAHPLSLYHSSPRFGEQWRSSPKPHSSPKMKLRYMKNIFPKADEMLLLDILTGADNNVQLASEKLISMGYVKRDFVPVQRKTNLDGTINVPKKPEDEKIIPLRPKEHTLEEKEEMKQRLKEKYPNIVERIILMALESVNYTEDRAIQILQIVQEEDELSAKKKHGLLQVTLENDETDLDGHPSTSGDNIITVVVETTQNANNENDNISEITTKKYQHPSINITTPTTATTQIILSNSRFSIANECSPQSEPTITKTNTKFTQNDRNERNTRPVSSPQLANKDTTITTTNSQISNSSISSTSRSSCSSSLSYPTLTTKSILARSKLNSIGINGYMHGSKLSSVSSAASLLEKLKLSRPRDKTNSLKSSQRNSIENGTDSEEKLKFQSLLGRISTIGPNSDLSKGADENLLLADYVTWNGANPDINLGQTATAGADISLLSGRSYKPLGHNNELCNGPKLDLAKGSIYTQIVTGTNKSAKIKCN